ncbi:glycoside hydrolase family 19 protein [Mesoflavibacter sp. CH_XMU1404-2]|uniref:glycoside hydrolase family 19 protein n=1 Tax=Mesoflavibacter sp. CH_XMU1404-2 TaxID=3107766 RepID=UPI00300BC197
MKNKKIIAGAILGLFAISGLAASKNVSLQNQAINAATNTFGFLTSEQQNNIRLITNAFTKYGDGDNSKLAYILATAWHESWLKPIKEIRAAQGTSLYNTQNQYWYTGYYGRGFVQLTWQSNYQKMGNWLGIDLVNNPDLALQPDIAAKILVYGMINGSFTGKKLSDYITGSYNDFYNARRVVNGLDQAQKINNYAISLTQYA